MAQADLTEAIAAYRAALPADVTSGEIWEAVRTDAMMRIPNSAWPTSRASGVPVFVYRFDWTAPGLGAAHASKSRSRSVLFDREGWGDAISYDPDAGGVGRHLFRRGWLRLATEFRSTDALTRLQAEPPAATMLPAASPGWSMILTA